MVKTLYKKDNNGKLMQWTIETKDDTFFTCDGYIGGKITQTVPTKCISKNIGRANGTTPEQQAVLEAEARVEKKRKKRWVDTIEEVDVEVNYPIDPMCAKEYSKCEKHLLKQQWFQLQPKLDGIRCTAKRGLPGLYTRDGNRIVSVPHIEAMVDDLFLNNGWLMAIDGELYNHDFKENFEDIVSMVRKGNITEEILQKSYQYMQYHVFDCITDDEDDCYNSRYKMLKAMTESKLRFKEGYDFEHHFRLVETKLVKNNEKVIAIIYDKFLNEGYEGLMYRNPDAHYQQGKRPYDLIKRKEHIDEEFILVDVIEGVGTRSGMAGRIVCKIGAHTFEANIKGKNKFTTAFEWYKELLINKHKYIGLLVTVRYQNLTKDGKPRFGRMIAVRNYE